MSRSEAQAAAVAVMWTAMLIALSVLWIQSPFLGPGTAFAVWSAPAAIAMAATVRWLHALSLPQIPRSPALVAVIALAWLGILVIAHMEMGARLALDGLIMRRDDLRLAGRMLHWLPMGFGVVLSIAGLAAGLEARYRLVHAPETPAMRRDPTR